MNGMNVTLESNATDTAATHVGCGCSTPAGAQVQPAQPSRRGLLTGTAAIGVAGAGGLLGGGLFTPAAAHGAHGGGPVRAKSYPGTNVVLLGTGGGPIPTAGRNMTSQAVVVDDVTYLIDCGSGIVGQIVDAGIPYGTIKNLFITHLHSDHISDYLPTVLFGRKIGPQPGFNQLVDVFGPGRAGALPAGVPLPGRTVVAPELPTPGTVDMHNNLLIANAYTINQMYIASATGPDIRDIVHPHDIVLPAGVGGGPAGPFEPPMEPFEVYSDDRVRVTATLVNHPPVFPAFGFRFDTDQGSVVFSGDTAPSENLIRLARGADLLVHEVMYGQAMLDNGTPPPLVGFLRALHTDVTEVGGIAARAGVKTLALSHIISVQPSSAYPLTLSDSAWAKPIRRDYDGAIVVGHDLMHLQIAQGRSKVVS